MTDDVSTVEAARMLGITSPATTRNWLEGGHFPGAYRTADGEWRFPRAAVLAMQRERFNQWLRNARGDMSAPDLGDDVEPVP